MDLFSAISGAISLVSWRDNGISEGAVRARLRNGWPLDKAVSVPISVKCRKGDE